MEILYAAVALGGHIRVGMEDNVMYAKGQLAESNRQFVDNLSLSERDIERLQTLAGERITEESDEIIEAVDTLVAE